MVHRATTKRPIKQELTVCIIYLQCFDTVSLVAGRAPGLSNCVHYATIKTQLVFDLGNAYEQYDGRCIANCYFLSVVLYGLLLRLYITCDIKLASVFSVTDDNNCLKFSIM